MKCLFRVQRTTTTCSRIMSRYCSTEFPSHPSFEEYRDFKNVLLASLPGGENGQTRVTRLDCMKPAVALQHYLQPIPLCRPPYLHTYDDITFHLAKTWEQLSTLSSQKVLLTRGVRDGIYVALEALSQNGQMRNSVLFPSDVYPVYEKIIQKTSTSTIFHQFETLADELNLSTVLSRADSAKESHVNSVILLPYPLTPIGRRFTSSEIDQLVCWLSDDSVPHAPRYLILDCVYSFKLEQDMKHIASLLSLQNVTAIHSLAKGWISPFLEPPEYLAGIMSEKIPVPINRSNFSSGVGFLYCCSDVWRSLAGQTLARFNLFPHHSSLQQAFHILHQQPQLPQILETRLQKQWRKLEASLRKMDPSFTIPHSGYFATMKGHWSDLYMNYDTLTVPTSVFGAHSSANGRSVISCLYNIKEDDFALHCEDIFCQTGQDMTPMYHVTTMSNFIRGYNKYSRRYCKSTIPESTFPNKFFLLHANQLPTGIEKAWKLLKKLDIKGDCLLVLHTVIKTWKDPQSGFVSSDEAEENALYVHPKGQYVRRNWIEISDLSVLSLEPMATLTGISVEEAAARSLRLQTMELASYQDVTPRTVSLMPIAKGCQARCPFCFSKGSVSNDVKQQRMYEDKVEEVLQAAKDRGAERAVITGGGEPFMLPFDRLLKIISQCSSKFSTVCAISNGYSLAQLSDSARSEALKALDVAGLTVLSLSRHAVTEDENEGIMWLRTESWKVAQSWRKALNRGELKSLTRLRWVCVLQKGGVDSLEKLREYVTFVINSGANEICFKELYVSTSVESVYHDHQSNIWSAENQVSLSLVLDFCESNGFMKTDELPWGAPIYEGVFGDSATSLKIAAYTEPSVFWERSHGLCRSWNYMANGEVLASLEDKDSQVMIHS